MSLARRLWALLLAILLVGATSREALANAVAVGAQVSGKVMAVPAAPIASIPGSPGSAQGVQALGRSPSLTSALPLGLPTTLAPRILADGAVRTGAPAALTRSLSAAPLGRQTLLRRSGATQGKAKLAGVKLRAKAMSAQAAPVLESMGKGTSSAGLRSSARTLHSILTGETPVRTSAWTGGLVPGHSRLGRLKSGLLRPLGRIGRNSAQSDVPAPAPSQDAAANTGIQHRLWAKIILGLVLGVGVGLLLGPDFGLLSAEVTSLAVKAMAFPGHLFLSLIRMVAVPLVFSSIVAGIGGSKNFQQLKHLGVRAGIYFTLTTVVATIIGISVAYLIQPGSFFPAAALSLSAAAAPAAAAGTFPGIVETILGLIPENPLAAFVSGNMLQLVFFAILMGVALASMKSRHSKPLLDLMDSTQRVCMTVVKWAMRLAPFAVFGLMAKVCATVGAKAILGMSVYMGTVVLGLLGVMAMYLLLVSVLGKKNPLSFLKKSRDPILLAFSTSSSAAAMPVSIKTAKEKLGVRPFVADIVVPVGSTINMDGTALYQVVATLFLAQIFGVSLTLGSLLLIIGTAVGASIGTPGTPGVGMVILSMVLSSVGIPLEGIALLIGVDRILDMCRSAVNVSGDLTASVVLDKLLGKWKKGAPVDGEERAVLADES